MKSRRSIESDLKESEEKHRVLFMNSPDAYLIIVDGIFVDFNHAALSMLGVKREQVQNKPPEFLSPEFQPCGKSSKIAASEKIKFALEHGRDTFEWVHRRMDGTEFTVEVSIAAIIMAGKPALFTTWRNITERKRLEEELRGSEEKFRDMANLLPQIVFESDITGRLTYANKQAFKILGYPEDYDITKLNTIDIFISEDKPRAIENIKRRLAGRIEGNNEYTMIRNDGSMMKALVYSNPIIKHGNPVGLRGIIVDITGLKKAEQKLRESEEKYRTLVDTMSDGVYRSTHNGKFIEANPAMVRILGYDSKEELMAIDIKTQLYFAEEERESADLAEKLEEMAVFRLRKKDGSEIWVEDQGKHILDKNGEILYHEGSLREVTDRIIAADEIKRKNEELQSLNAQKDKFFSIIAHDLKSPFNSIVGFSRLLTEQIHEKDYAGIEKYAHIIEQSSSKALNLLGNLMEWSRSQTGRMDFNPEFYEMVNLINETIDLFADIARHKSIAIKTSLPPILPLLADKAMISTVMRNLISNALKFTRSGGEILISAVESQNEVSVSVSDNGVGIPPGNIKKLFRIDQSISTSGTQNEQGTGLGLILCREFVEKHGGKIWVESEEGKGSVFSFNLKKYN